MDEPETRDLPEGETRDHAAGDFKVEGKVAGMVPSEGKIARDGVRSRLSCPWNVRGKNTG